MSTSKIEGRKGWREHWVRVLENKDRNINQGHREQSWVEGLHLTVRPGWPMGHTREDEEADDEESVLLSWEDGVDWGDHVGALEGLSQLQSPSRRQHAALWNSVYFLNSADITFSQPFSPSLLLPPILSPSLSFSSCLIFFLSSTSLWLRVTTQPKLRALTCSRLPDTPQTLQRTSPLVNDWRADGSMF